MPSVDVNYWAVIVAALINMVIGSLWYSRMMYGKSWAKLTGKKPGEVGNGNAGYALTALGSLIQAWILVHFIRYAGSNTFWKGALTAFWLWLGFMAITTAVNFIFEGRSWRLWGINAGYFLVVMLINGGLLAAWA